MGIRSDISVVKIITGEMKFRTKMFLLLVFVFFLNLYILHYHSWSSEEETELQALFPLNKVPVHEDGENEIDTGKEEDSTPIIVENEIEEEKEEKEEVSEDIAKVDESRGDWDWSDEYLRRESQQPRKFREVKYNPERVEICPEMVTRDLRTDPMTVSGRNTPKIKCSINYKVQGGDVDVAVGSRPKCGYSYKWSMENIHVHGVDLPGNTDLTSEVPVPYFSWLDFGMMDEGYPVEKTEESLASTFISNCGPRKRLDILKKLQENGVKIDSYGRCMHNKDEPSSIRRQFNSVFQNVKMFISSRYKFLYSPENGETKDYITEKFFLPFCIGTVPIYIGAPNARDFAPAPDSYLDVRDFETVEDLAEYIKELSQDEEKYSKYLKWKEDGPSRHFLALMDLNNVHSSCRFALRGADLMRVEFGNDIGHEKLDNELVNAGKRYFRIRERNTYYLSYIYLDPGFTMWDLERVTREKLGWEDIYKFYYLWDRAQVPIGMVEDLEQLKDGDEIEVIFLDSQLGRRSKFDDWMERAGKKLSDFK